MKHYKNDLEIQSGYQGVKNIHDMYLLYLGLYKVKINILIFFNSGNTFINNINSIIKKTNV